MPIRQETLRTRWFAAQLFAPTTRHTYTETLRSFERRYPVSAERVTHELLLSFLLTDADGSDTGRAPATIKRQRAELRSFWRWAHREGYVKVNPAARLDELRVGSGERRPGRWLTRDEALHLLSCCADGSLQGQRDRTLILVALLTGLRRAELAGLRWRDLDLTQRRLSVKGKGSKLATIGLPEQAAHALREWRREAGERSEQGKARHDGPVFPTGHYRGGLHGSGVYTLDWTSPMGLWAVHRMVARRAEDAGLGVVATHDLRRTFAGLLDEQGTDLKGIQAALRHSSPEVTARCYLDRSPRRAVEAVASLKL